MRIHIIQSGDTFWILAERYECSIDDLMSCNPDLKSNALLPGDKLYVPELNDKYLIFFWSLIQFTIDWIINPLASSFNLSLPRLSSTHKIKKDESIISLSRDYGCSDADIKEANPHLRTDILRVGDVINVPKTRRNATISTFLYWGLRIFLFYYAKPLVPSSNTLQADVAQFGQEVNEINQ